LRLTEAKKEEKAERVADIVDAIIAICNTMHPESTAWDVRAKIDAMFSTTPDGEQPKTLTLTTIHKAKGREWERVFWYGRNRWNPSPYARQDWQYDQEVNLMYVAATRAKSELYDIIVPVPPRRAA
jgi:superfamily I DNA/RNA helicase